MHIESIKIDTFGSLSDLAIIFECGINVIEGENESGKSTISAFIKFILYGMSGRAQEGGIPERTRYINWAGNTAKGSMTVKIKSKKYRIERTLVLHSDGPRELAKETVNIVDIETNTYCHRGRVPGEVFLGVGEKVFVSTAFFRQLSDTKIDSNEINSAIENMLFSADESINTEKALSKLVSARRSLLHINGKGGQLYESSQKLEKLKDESEKAKQTNIEIFATEGQLSDKTRLLTERKAHIAALSKKEDAYNAHLTLKRFDYLRAVDKKAENLLLEYESFTAQNGVDGFLPDADFIRELRDTERHLSLATAEKKEKDSRLERVRHESAELEKQLLISAEIDARGGSSELKAEHDKTAVSARSFQLSGFVFIILLLIAGGGGYPLILLFPFTWAKVIVGGALLLFASFAFTLLTAAANKRKELRRLYDVFSVKNADELDTLILQCKQNKEKLADYQQKLAALELEIKTLSKTCTGKQAALDNMFSKCKIPPVKDREETFAAISKCEYLQSESQEYKNKLQQLKIESKMIKNQLSEYDEENLRAKTEIYSEKELEILDISELRRDFKLNTAQIETLQSKVTALTGKLAALNATATDPISLSAKIYETESQITRDRLRHDAYILAAEAITNSGENLRQRIAPRLTDYACRMISAMTDGKYKSVGVSGALDMTFESEGGTYALDYLSAGTRDLAYIGLRLALIDLFFPESFPPLIFDESFAHQDNKRSLRIIKLLNILSEAGQQSIIFTCHDREGTLAATLGDFKHIKLK